MPRGIQSFNHKVFEYFLYVSGETDASFAEKLGCSRQLVFLWRVGASKPTQKNVAKIADELDITQSVLKITDDEFSEMVKDVTNQELRQRLMRDKLFDSFNKAIEGDSAEEWRHALRVAVFLNEFHGVFGSDRHTTLKDAMQIENIEPDTSDDTEDDLDNEMNEMSDDETDSD